MFSVYHLTRAMRDILIEHIDGCSPINMRDAARHRVIRALMIRGFLRGGESPVGAGPIMKRPHKTWITERGREALAKILADHADALVRAGMGGGFIPRTSIGEPDEPTDYVPSSALRIEREPRYEMPQLLIKPAFSRV